MEGSTKQSVVLLGGSGVQSWRYLSRIDDFDVTVVAPATDSGGNTGLINMFEGSEVMVSGDIGKIAAAFLSGAGDNEAREFLLHRIQFEPLKGYTMGNLVQLVAHEMTGSYGSALDLLGRIFPFNARLMLATRDVPVLCAEYANGEVMKYEHEIDEVSDDTRGSVEKLWVEPADMRINPAAEKALDQAEYIGIGPGDVYTGYGSILVVPGVREALIRAHTRGAKIVAVMNLMTKPGHTGGWSAARHVDCLLDQFQVPLNAVLVNTEPIDEEAISRYEAKNSEVVVADIEDEYREVTVLRGELVDEAPKDRPGGDAVPRSFIRHDPVALHALFLQYQRSQSKHH